MGHTTGNDALDRDDGRWGDVKERFGITDPREVMAQVDEIVDTRLT